MTALTAAGHQQLGGVERYPSPPLKFTTAMTVQCDVYADFVRSYVEVVKSLSYCYRKLIVSTCTFSIVISSPN